MKASIALQVLPLSQGIDRIAIIDQVIAYLQAQSVIMVVTPFETVLEGEFDELMRILKEALEMAGQEADNVFANVKINVGEILSIDEKLEKYTETHISLLGFLGVLSIWQLAGFLKLLPKFILPTPLEILQAFVRDREFSLAP